MGDEEIAIVEECVEYVIYKNMRYICEELHSG